jgi:hypothetical protein
MTEYVRFSVLIAVITFVAASFLPVAHVPPGVDAAMVDDVLGKESPELLRRCRVALQRFRVAESRDDLDDMHVARHIVIGILGEAAMRATTDDSWNLRPLARDIAAALEARMDRIRRLRPEKRMKYVDASAIRLPYRPWNDVADAEEGDDDDVPWLVTLQTAPKTSQFLPT